VPPPGGLCRVQRQPGRRRRQEGRRAPDDRAVGSLPPQPGLLHDVLGVAGAAESLAGDPGQPRPRPGEHGRGVIQLAGHGQAGGHGRASMIFMVIRPSIQYLIVVTAAPGRHPSDTLASSLVGRPRPARVPGAGRSGPPPCHRAPSRPVNDASRRPCGGRRRDESSRAAPGPAVRPARRSAMIGIRPRAHRAAGQRYRAGRAGSAARAAIAPAPLPVTAAARRLTRRPGS
jgi:hypothetical protein